ncbi:hypothetical protein GOP47_0008445 [Adiantum capillus-veneris]|uniref:CG-1 domain-containing protein n=1 Tax=Adiantum capillus-veneris TaxID=13818 RepID=A0A9D4UYB5_ADICA|nr:hypothetical protein GOP47_0008445 [Adiantum capillus-veneris]
MDHRRYGVLSNQPEAALCQILQEAQHRWLRPTEVCEILRNYRKFKLTPDPPHKPQSGSLFLFDRKALRYFRKDGHNWRKKKDGKTVREAHERLKAGSVEVLHCYYAHGEENENFQRRSYWMLDTNEHIVLVHYREVKEGSRSGLRSPNSYSVDGSSTFGNPRGVAGTSPQTSPLVSPRSSSPNTSSADWNGGPTYSPECDEPESSDDTDQFRLRELEAANTATNRGPVVAIGNATSVGNIGRLNSTPFPFINQNGGRYGEKSLPPSYEGTNGTAAAAYTSITGLGGAQALPLKQENGAVTPPGGFDLLEYCEVLKQVKSWGSKETTELANMRLQSHSDQYKDKAVTAGNQSTWFKDPTEMILNEMVGTTQAAGDNRLSVVGASWQTSSQGFLDTSSMPASKYQQSFPGDGLASMQVVNATPWSVVLDQLAGNGSVQGDLLDGFDNSLMNDSQRSQQVFPQTFNDNLITENNAGRFDTAGGGADIKDSPLIHTYSSVFRDFQADIPTQHEDQDAFKKFESFGRWMGQDIGGDVILPLSSDSTYWASALAEEAPGLTQQMQLDVGAISSVPHEIGFSITDFSPNNTLSSTNTKVLVSGKFGDMVEDPTQIKWGCMFGDVEVPAELVQPGVLRCNAPTHPPGKTPFCVTRGNKIACSEIKEFEFHAECKPSFAQALEVAPSSKKDMLFQIRLAKMLSNVSVLSTSKSLLLDRLNRDVSSELSSLGLFDEWEEMEDQLTESGCLGTSLKEHFVQKLLKEKLQIWLLQKILDGGKGAAVWDDNGLGVLHMGAALGYTWIITPTIAAGVNINFRDSRGWTALHWAAHCGREAMVVALMAKGAAPGAKTDPTSAFPGGQTPADLASAEQHKGIAGYLAESSLTSHLFSLTLKSKVTESLTASTEAVESPSKRSIVQDTLAAVRNATQAAARIQSEFRVESFRKKQGSYQLEEDEYGISNEEAQYIVAAQKLKRGPSIYEDELAHVAAAVRIQQNFRGWKGRRNFLLFRQNVVKIQAHFRGHQVRKQYKKIIWSVSIVEKAILRWRRKRRGLRGFESVALTVNVQGESVADDDFLKAGRKQIEAGLEKALARVQSMVRSPEAQEQYRRLLDGYQKAKVHFEGNYDTPLITEDKEQGYSEDSAMSAYQ